MYKKITHIHDNNSLGLSYMIMMTFKFAFCSCWNHARVGINKEKKY